MFYFNIKVSLTHPMHPFCSNPLLDKNVHLPDNVSPPVHSSLGLGTDIAIIDVGTCTAEIPGAIQGCQQGKKYYQVQISPKIPIKCQLIKTEFLAKYR